MNPHAWIRMNNARGWLIGVMMSVGALAAPAAPAGLIDAFNGASRQGWTDTTVVPGVGAPVQQNGQLKFVLPSAVGQSYFAATAWASPTFTLREGTALEFRVDLVSGNDPGAFGALAWIPTAQKVSDLAGYSIAKAPGEILIAKGLNKYFSDEPPR